MRVGGPLVNLSLIDTDIWIDILRGKDTTVKERADTYWRQHGVFILSAITIAEIVRGLLRIQQAEVWSKWRAIEGHLRVLPVDKEVAELAGEIYARLDAAGTPIGRMDPLIAATALHHHLMLVSANLAHYRRIIEVGYPLTLDNWRET